MAPSSRRLRLVPSPDRSGPGLARAREDLDVRLGRVLREVGELTDAMEADEELFTHLASATQALGLAQRRLRGESG